MGSGPTLTNTAGRAVFLDRDGTLNRAFVRNGVSVPPASTSEFELLPGVPEAIALLHGAGLRLVVITNQPDVARGTQDRTIVEAMNGLLRQTLPIDLILCCFHDDIDACTCRKPAPGLCIAAAQQLGLDLKRSFFVGDSWRDVAAGRGAGCTTVLLRVPYSRAEIRSDFEAGDLSEAAAIIMRCVEEDAV